jgi:hypothetical protein
VVLVLLADPSRVGEAVDIDFLIVWLAMRACEGGGGGGGHGDSNVPLRS